MSANASACIVSDALFTPFALSWSLGGWRTTDASTRSARTDQNSINFARKQSWQV